MDIKINFINRSDDQNDNQVIFFQNSITTSFNELAVAKNSNPQAGNIVAWKLISDSQPGDETTFKYPHDFTINAGMDADADGDKISGVKGLTFKPTIWVGVQNNATVNNVMDSAILSDINTEISLVGITEANIIMTGGGPGTTSPFQFTLQPVNQ